MKNKSLSKTKFMNCLMKAGIEPEVVHSVLFPTEVSNDVFIIAGRRGHLNINQTRTQKGWKLYNILITHIRGFHE